jgi:hypothetical protein
MLVATLTVVASTLFCAFALTALWIARVLPEHAGTQRHAWRITAFVFLVYAASHLTQAVSAAMALRQGPGSPVYETYVRWFPMANHSRTLLVWSLYLCLGMLAWKGASAWRTLRYAYVPLALGMMVLGGMIGWWEGPFDPVRHLSNTSLLDVVGFLVATSVLFVTMLRGTIDRALWFAIFLYASSSVVSSLFIAALAWINVADAWTPRPWVMEVSRVSFAVAIVAMAVWRLRLARRRIPLPGLLGAERVRQMLA